MVLEPLEWGRVSDNCYFRIGCPVQISASALENMSPTTIPIYDVKCSEDESVGEEETELFEQILVRLNLLAPGSHFIIGIHHRRGSRWRSILFLRHQRRRSRYGYKDLLEELQNVWGMHLPLAELGRRQDRRVRSTDSQMLTFTQLRRMTISMIRCTQKPPA